MPTTGKIKSNRIGYGICAQCFKEFKYEKASSGRGYNTKKFCSTECENAFHRKRSEEQYGWGICVVCNKKFKREKTQSGGYSATMFCSDECKQIYADKKHPGRVKYCAQCGKRVPLIYHNDRRVGSYDIAKFCSDGCRDQYFREKYGKVNCIICHKQFDRETFIDYRGHREYRKGIRSLICSDCKKLIPCGSSDAEILFSNELLKLGIQTGDREYRIDSFYYDFEIPNFNILIDVNPSFTHCANSTCFSQGKDVYYHYNRAKLAAENGFLYLCLWDWNDRKELVKFIYNVINKFGFNYKFELEYHKEPDLYLNKKDTKEIMLVKNVNSIDLDEYYSKNYLAVYTCGKYKYRNIDKEFE